MRIHDRRVRGEDQVGAPLGASSQVVLDRPRIAPVVLARAELGRIDEDRDDDEAGLGAAPLDQGDVPGVQGPHRRDEADDFPRARAAPTASRTSSIVFTRWTTAPPFLNVRADDAGSRRC